MSAAMFWLAGLGEPQTALAPFVPATEQASRRDVGVGGVGGQLHRHRDGVAVGHQRALGGHRRGRARTEAGRKVGHVDERMSAGSAVLTRVPLRVAGIAAAGVQDDAVVRQRAVDPVLHQRSHIHFAEGVAPDRREAAIDGSGEVSSGARPRGRAVAGVPVGALGPGAGQMLDVGQVVRRGRWPS